MRKITLYLFLLLAANAFSQQNETAVAFVRDFMSSNNLTGGEMRLVRNWPIRDSADVKKTLFQRFSKFIESANGDIQLTKSELEYVMSKYVGSYMQPWQEQDFKGTKLIAFDQLLPYLQADENNTVLMASHPIFLRNDTVFFISYTNLCCGEVMGANAELFYRKINGKWEKWAFVQQGAN